ncbi:hypothetical protein DFH29DRAFT_954442, partial [Suillus ampliporus]
MQATVLMVVINIRQGAALPLHLTCFLAASLLSDSMSSASLQAVQHTATACCTDYCTVRVDPSLVIFGDSVPVPHTSVVNMVHPVYEKVIESCH